MHPKQVIKLLSKLLSKDLIKICGNAEKSFQAKTKNNCSVKHGKNLYELCVLFEKNILCALDSFLEKKSFGRFKVNYLIPVTLLLKEGNFTWQNLPYYPVFKPPPPRIKSQFKPTGLNDGLIFSIREIIKTLQMQLFFLLNISENYRIPS